MRLLIDAEVDAAAGLLSEIRERLDDPRELLVVLGEDLEEYEREVFESRDHGQWAELDQVTIDAKHSNRVLVDTGHLLQELTRYKNSGESVVVNQGTAYYGRFHRDGDRGMEKRNPAPKPDQTVLAKWSRDLLGFIVTGRRP